MKLRKSLFSLIILVSISQFAFAGEGSIGIKLGANFSKNGFIAGDTKFQPGLTAGLTYEKKFAKIGAFEIGGLYHWKRSKAQDFKVDEIKYDDFKNGFHFVEIPALFKVYIFDWLNVNAGGYVSYIIAAKADGVDPFGVQNTWNLISDGEFRDVNGEDFLNRLDFGILFGVELITKTGFGFGARYSQGFGDVTDNDFKWDISNVRPDSKRVKTSSIITYVFYNF